MPTSPAITLVQLGGLTPEKTISPVCGKVHMALRFKGLEYDIQNAETPGQIKKHNPRGRTPALIIGDETFVDSTDILTELDRRFPEPPMMPEDPRERAQVKILEDWADEVIYFHGLYLRFVTDEGMARLKQHLFGQIPMPLRMIVPAIVRRDLTRRAKGQGVGVKDEATVLREVTECYQALEEMLDGRSFLVGERLTRADISVAAALDQHGIEELTPQLAAAINSLPNVSAWLDRVHEVAPSAA